MLTDKSQFVITPLAFLTSSPIIPFQPPATFLSMLPYFLSFTSLQHSVYNFCTDVSCNLNGPKEDKVREVAWI